MTQALNLANFANNLNTSGATSNAGLQNSAVTVTAGTGLSGGGAVSLGGSVSLANAGVTSIVAGTGISVSGATGAVTVTSTVSGGVSSVNAQTGAVVTTNLGSIGSVIMALNYNGGYLVPNSTVSGGSLYYPTTYQGSMTSGYFGWGAGTNSTPSGRLGPSTLNTAQVYYNAGNTGNSVPQSSASLSGTWRALSIVGPQTSYGYCGCGGITPITASLGLFIRIS